jgi:hypothetical protein
MRYGCSMSDFFDSYGAGSLRQVSVTDIQKAIAEALSKLTDQDPQSLLVSIASIEFGFGKLKMALSVDPNHAWASAEIDRQVKANPGAARDIPF